jgi:hypothetical protein
MNILRKTSKNHVDQGATDVAIDPRAGSRSDGNVAAAEGKTLWIECGLPGRAMLSRRAAKPPGSVAAWLSERPIEW